MKRYNKHIGEFSYKSSLRLTTIRVEIVYAHKFYIVFT